MTKEIISGIYCIENIQNNKKYIGLSNNIYSRWDNHRNMLKRNNHFNIFLQRSWNKYGENNFVFKIVEICKEAELSQKEISYIELYKSNNDNFGYNLSSGGDNPKINKESLIVKSLKYSKRILQFTKEGEFIAEYLNSYKVADLYNVSPSAIHQCCLGKIKSAYGYVWKFKAECNIVSELNTDMDIPHKYKVIPNFKSICQIDLEGNFIKEWRTCNEVGEFYNISSENIRSCCDKNYGRKTCEGFIWMYSEDYYINGINLENYKKDTFTKQINQYDLDGNFINTYDSAREAEQMTGIGHKMISRVCNGKRPYTHGFIWKFAS